MPRYRATLAYDGTAYRGFQRQAGNTPTIQRAVEQAVAAVCGQQITVIGAGRTDTGVHASGQVIAFDVDWPHDDDALLRALNANLPEDIAVQHIRQQDGFHPRFDARSRLYRYTVVQSPQRQPLLRHRAWHLWSGLDATAMQKAAEMLVGRHDFAAFGRPPQGTNTIREVLTSRWQWWPCAYGTLLTYDIEANAFLHHMVRRIVGTLVELGRSALDMAGFEAVFRSGDLSQIKTIAPPQGLVLVRVRYPGEGEIEQSPDELHLEFE
jgi:tRNA pseudouridine38-40 synthase